MNKYMLLGLLNVFFLSEPVFSANGAELYYDKGCIACHGRDGQSPVLPSYPKIIARDKEYLIRRLREIKKSTTEPYMSRFMKSVSDNEIKILATYISNGFKPDKKKHYLNSGNKKLYKTVSNKGEITHFHGSSFKHTHILPSIGIKHKHRGSNQNIGKALPFSEQKPKLSKNWIYDQNNCIHYNPKPQSNETVTWSGRCKEGYADGYGKRIWSYDYNGRRKNSSNYSTLVRGKVEKKLTKEQILANEKANRESMARAVGTLAVIIGGFAKGVGAVVDSANESVEEQRRIDARKPNGVKSISSRERDGNSYSYFIQCYPSGYGKIIGSPDPHQTDNQGTIRYCAYNVNGKGSKCWGWVSLDKTWSIRNAAEFMCK